MDEDGFLWGAVAALLFAPLTSVAVMAADSYSGKTVTILTSSAVGTLMLPLGH
jgi:hypothetical protein